jgi:hypothetical protein
MDWLMKTTGSTMSQRANKGEHSFAKQNENECRVGAKAPSESIHAHQNLTAKSAVYFISIIFLISFRKYNLDVSPISPCQTAPMPLVNISFISSDDAIR